MTLTRVGSKWWAGHLGSAPATVDLISGRVTVGFPGIAGMLPQIKAGRLRALAVTSAKRSPELPDLPTVAEAGVPDDVAQAATKRLVMALGGADPTDVSTRLLDAVPQLKAAGIAIPG